MQSKTALPWDDVRLFLALCRARTMGGAAQTLGVDPSTVSRRLAALEATLDTVLFDRGRDGLRPTDAAEALRPAAELVEDGIFQFTHAADGLERAVEGVVRLASPPDVADVLVVPALQRLLPRHPALRVVLVPGEATVDLDRREADLALRAVRPTTGDLVVKRILATRFVPATAPTLAATLGPLDGPDAIAAAPWIGWATMNHVPPARWLAAQAEVDPVVRTDSLRSQFAAAAAGLGVALVPAPSVAHYGLVALDVSADVALPPLSLYLVTHRALRRVPRIAAVWEALLAAPDTR